MKSFVRLSLMIGLSIGVVQSSTATAGAALTKAPNRKSPSPETVLRAEKNNENLRTLFLQPGSVSVFSASSSATSVRPFADYEKTGYVFINGDFQFSSRQAKEAIAANLPPDTTLVVFVEDSNSSRAQAIRTSFSKWLGSDRLKIIELQDASDGFWARDGLPVPVKDSTTGDLKLVDAQYYYSFEPDKEVGSLFGASVSSHRFNFEGGNFMANDLGHCILVNNRSHSKIPDTIFETMYGCKRVQRLKHLSGIGHIDEHVRFISQDTVLSDLPEYKTELEAAGLKVIMLPRPQSDLETYVNSLIVNGVAVVPTYGQSTDKAALDIYSQAGFKAVSADSSSLSNDGEGSVHCITMTYPPVPFAKMLKILGAREVL